MAIIVHSGVEKEESVTSTLRGDLLLPIGYWFEYAEFQGTVMISDNELIAFRAWWPNKAPVSGNTITFYGTEARTIITALNSNWDDFKYTAKCCGA
jgi:hypothetical protein